MAKHVVLDAIARSGTTLMSALLRSQEKTMAFCPGFNDSLSCHDIGEWPHGACQQDFVVNSEIDFEKFKQESFSQIVDYSQYYGLTKEEWKSIIFDANNPDEVRINIEKSFPDIEIFCYRWNQGMFYFNEWLKKGENYLWLSMVRNPLDRAVSSFEKHHWQFKESLLNTLGFTDKLEMVRSNPRFYLVNYEDLVQDPNKVISGIYDYFGCKISKINLTEVKGSNGKDFIPQSSKIKNVDDKKDGYLVDAEKFSGIYDTGVGRYKSDGYIDSQTHEVFKRYLSEIKEYKRYF